MYGVSGIPHAEFNGTINSIGGGTNMYPYYLDIYEQLIDDDSPVYIDFVAYLNQDDGGLDLVADVVMTGDITTSDNKVVFLLTYKYTNDYFCTVEGYEYVDFDLYAEGETGVYTHHFSVDPAWDMSSIHTIALIQSYSSSSKEIYQGMITNEWQDPTMDMTLAYSGDWVTVGLPLGMDNDYYLNIFPDAFENTLFTIQIEVRLGLSVGAVALVAVVDKDGADFGFKEFRLFFCYLLCGQQRQRAQHGSG